MILGRVEVNGLGKLFSECSSFAEQFSFVKEFVLSKLVAEFSGVFFFV